MSLVGLLSLCAPPRRGAAEALKRAAEVGIELKLVTGDARPRATALARQIGMDVPDGAVIVASDLCGPKKESAALRGSIFAETVPADKYHLVQLLQHLGRHVAATGDGVNDAPALQTADVGIALASGTDATKGAADLVLLDDNLEVIIDGVQEGRRTFTNINRYLLYTMVRSEEHTSELQSHLNLVCRLLLEKKNAKDYVNFKPPLITHLFGGGHPVTIHATLRVPPITHREPGHASGTRSIPSAYHIPQHPE